ncbi:MAG: hypothetical protein M1825_004761 [Sarcosagium campestre]|nr:MAG: hypothetical protein M1825_004761 [Sarcosagium campestre]
MSKVNEEKAPILAADASEVAPVSGLSNNQRLPVTVSRPTPYTFDLGNLTGFDSNPLPSTTDSGLAANARDGAQALINQLLTTCPISSTSSGVLLSLPPASTPLPREKPLPVAKPPTKWQQFALKKGIKDKKKEGKLVYDEATGDWVPKWGYKGANKKGEDDWLVEVDEEKERAREAKLGDGRGNTRALPRRERLESVRRNERKMRANDRKSRKTAT